MTDDSGLVNNRAGMGLPVFLLRLFDRHCRPAFQGLLTAVEHLKHIQPFFAVGVRRFAAGHRVKEGLAFGPQRLPFGQRHTVRLGLARHRNVARPLHRMRIEQKLVRPRRGVVKDRHLLITNHH